MQDRPTAPELLDALAAQLFTEVREWVPRERRFQVLVAANLCAVIARELRAGAASSIADTALFRQLLGEGEQPVGPEEAEERSRLYAARLAVAIRKGEVDERLDDVLAGLGEHVRRKLDVARPGYDTP